MYIQLIHGADKEKYALAYDCHPEINSSNLNDFKSEYDAVLLYNIAAKQYRWYIRDISENGDVLFMDLLMNSNNPSYKNLNKTEGVKNMYSFTKEEMQTNQVLEDGTPKLSKFEETFIIPDNIQTEKVSIEDIHNIETESLKDHIKTAVNNYKDMNSIITEEVKTATETKITELETKKEQIKVAEEEKAKKEAEEKAKAEEEAKKKAEEEAKKAAEGLKVGNYTLKYGTYTGKDAQFVDEQGLVNWNISLTLKQDGTYTFTSSNQEMQPSSKGTYKISNAAGSPGIQLSSGMVYIAIANNQLQVPAGSGATLKYQGN